ncbi:MAG: FHA domain-containing protein [Gemmataceae bacterium]
MRAQLSPLTGGPAVVLHKDLTLVGRREDCDFRIDHKSISKLHCVIVKTDGMLLLRDLGSTNGTRVNGQRIRRAALLANDQLSIAGFEYRVEFGPGEAAAVEDHTQQMDAKDVGELLRRLSSQGAKENNGAAPPLNVKPNLLPDVYENDEKPPLR